MSLRSPDDEARVRRDFRLLPAEQLAWTGRPELDVPRGILHRAMVGLGVGVAVIAGLFATLLLVAHLPGAGGTALVAAYAIAGVVALELVARSTKDTCEFVLTDRRALVRSRASVRSVDLATLSYRRIRWHALARGVGTVEFVRAVPFGPLMRQERVVMHNVRWPERLITQSPASERPHLEPEPALLDLLDADERVVWGGGPDGSLIGWHEVLVALLGIALGIISVVTGVHTLATLVALEGVGLAVGSPIWVLFFLACLATFALVAVMAGVLVWWGTVRSAQQGAMTEYVVTTHRVLIRRGRSVLSLDRTRVAHLAELRAPFGATHVLFVLDGPEARALGDSGALTGWLPPREVVPPVFFSLREVASLRRHFEDPREVE